MAELPRVSEAEWEVMRILWDRHPRTAAEVIEALGADREWSDRTVKTLLSRLLKKGVLTHEIEGRRYLYRPRLTRDRCVRAEGESFLKKVFGGATSPLLAHFVKQGKLSPDEIAELRDLLRDKERESREGSR
jgi:BlaI family transcriptional regulator, penicillinase repressor